MCGVCVGGQFLCFNFQPALWDVIDEGCGKRRRGSVVFDLFFKLPWLVSWNRRVRNLNLFVYRCPRSGVCTEIWELLCLCGGTRVLQFVLFFKLTVYPGTSTGKRTR